MSKYETIEGTISFPKVILAIFKETELCKNYIDYAKTLIEKLQVSAFHLTFTEFNPEPAKPEVIMSTSDDIVTFTFSEFHLRNYYDIQSDLLSLLAPGQQIEIDISIFGETIRHYTNTGSKLTVQILNEAPIRVIEESH